MMQPRTAPMIGREAELALMDAVLRAATSGNGSTMFVSGDGGVGKTRILASAAEKATREGWNVVLGRAYAVETGIPYSLFADALLPSLRQLEPGALSVLSRGGTAELAYLFPALSSSGNRTSAGAGADPSELKSRLLWNFTQFLGRFAARQPLCLVLENLQWADAASLELFHFVARQISGHRIALLASYNETERDSNQMLRTTEQSLVKLGAATCCRVGPLSQTDVGEMLREMFGVDPDTIRQFTALLYGWTRGNPFFVEETVKWLVESAVLREQDGRWTGWEVESLQLPPTVRDAVASRLGRLSASARELANLAAVVGTRVTFAQLVALSRTSDTLVAEAVDELCAERVLAEVEGPAGPAYDFMHPIMQQVTYSSLGHARSRLLHAAVAEALEKYYGKKSLAHAGELAFHFTRSTSMAPKAIQYLGEAGRTALQTYANREAADFLGAALEQIDNLDDGSIDRDEIVRNLARARQRLGNYEGALALWETARQKAVAAGNHNALTVIEHRMGLACYWDGRYDEALAHYTAGLNGVGGSPDNAVVMRLHLARGMCFQDLGKLDDAKAEMECALQAAEAAKSTPLLARAHRALLLLYAWTGPADVALFHGRKAVELAVSSKDLMLEWTAHWGMAVLAGLTSDAAGMIKHIRESEHLAERLKSPLLALWSAELSVQYASTTGDWDAGLATGERTIALARSLRQRALLPRLLVWTGLIHLWRSDLARAKTYFDEAWQSSGAGSDDPRINVPTLAPTHMGLAAYHLETNNFAEAIRIGEAGMEIADRSGYLAWSLQFLLPVVGEASLWIRDFERAERHSVRMRRDATRLGNRLGLAMADACDGMLLLLRDADFVAAIPLLRTAAETLESIPYPDSAARVRRILAWALRDNGDRDGAMREFRRAHDVFAKLHATTALTEVREDIRKLGVRPPSRTLVAGAGGLTGRELEITRMVARRKSNREIGSKLDISARTVSTHMSNIFLKLGVASRGELADVVRTRFPEAGSL